VTLIDRKVREKEIKVLAPSTLMPEGVEKTITKKKKEIAGAIVLVARPLASRTRQGKGLL